MDLQDKMHERGLVVLLGLPNVTAATHEMDQYCSYLKVECDVSTHHIAGMRIAARVKTHKKAL